MQRYMLRAPMGLGYAASPGMSFRDFIGAYGSPSYAGFMPYSQGRPGMWTGEGGLRGIAEQIGALSALTGEQFLDVLDPQTGYAGTPIGDPTRTSLQSLTPLQQYFYRTQYGTGREAAVNQMALASLLENQRLNTQPGGMMAQAVAQTLDELQQNLMARDPQANFLNWYLGRTQRGHVPSSTNAAANAAANTAASTPQEAATMYPGNIDPISGIPLGVTGINATGQPI